MRLIIGFLFEKELHCAPIALCLSILLGSVECVRLSNLNHVIGDSSKSPKSSVFNLNSLKKSKPLNSMPVGSGLLDSAKSAFSPSALLGGVFGGKKLTNMVKSKISPESFSVGLAKDLGGAALPQVTLLKDSMDGPINSVIIGARNIESSKNLSFVNNFSKSLGDSRNSLQYSRRSKKNMLKSEKNIEYPGQIEIVVHDDDAELEADDMVSIEVYLKRLNRKKRSINIIYTPSEPVDDDF
jgi:hypothetical protein